MKYHCPICESKELKLKFIFKNEEVPYKKTERYKDLKNKVDYSRYLERYTASKNILTCYCVNCNFRWAFEVDLSLDIEEKSLIKEVKEEDKNIIEMIKNSKDINSVPYENSSLTNIEINEKENITRLENGEEVEHKFR